MVGRLVEGTSYAGVMLDNEFFNGGDMFIEHKPKNAKFRYAISYANAEFGVWVDTMTLTYFITSRIPSDSTQVLCLTTDDMRPSRTMIGAASPLLKQLTRLFKIGGLRFESAGIREMFVDALRYCGLR